MTNILAIFSCSQFSLVPEPKRFFIAIPFSVSDERASKGLDDMTRHAMEHNNGYMEGPFTLDGLLRDDSGKYAEKLLTFFFDGNYPAPPPNSKLLPIEFVTAFVDTENLPVNEWFSIPHSHYDQLIQKRMFSKTSHGFRNFMEENSRKVDLVFWGGSSIIENIIQQKINIEFKEDTELRKNQTNLFNIDSCISISFHDIDVLKECIDSYSHYIKKNNAKYIQSNAFHYSILMEIMTPENEVICD